MFILERKPHVTKKNMFSIEHKQEHKCSFLADLFNALKYEARYIHTIHDACMYKIVVVLVLNAENWIDDF